MTHVWTDVFSILFAFASVFLIFIVLLQRGRGGGLAGAFGATGGQSAFGTKAGDVFTKITIVCAVIWVALAAVTGFAMTRESQGRFQSQAQTETEQVAPLPTPNGKSNPFEPDQGAKNGSATKAPASKESKQPAPAKSTPTMTTPPAKSAPAPDAKKQPADPK